jgi:hypothetical protein
VHGGANLVGRAAVTRHHAHDRQPEVQRDPRVQRQLARRSHPGEVGADHEDALALRREGMEARDDLLERAARVRADRVVLHPQRRLVRRRTGPARPQQVDERIARIGGLHDSAEHSEPADAPRQQMVEPERDRGLAGRRPAARDIETARRHLPADARKIPRGGSCDRVR